MTRSVPVLSLLFVATALAGCVVGDDGPAPGGPLSEVPVVNMTVERITQVDAERWSGEPSILALESGTLLITGVGGLTRYVEDPTDIPGRFGQSYIWRSTDDGVSWQFVDLGLPGPAGDLAPYRNAMGGVEGDLAQGDDERVYFVDLNSLASNTLSASDDDGESWLAAQHPAVGEAGTDRPWVAALGDDVYVKYLALNSGFRVAHSTDRGLTFPEDIEIEPCSQADMAVDRALDHVLLPCAQGRERFLLRTGTGPMDWQRIEAPVAEGPASGGFPGVAVIGPGEYVFVWVEEFDDGMRTRMTYTLDEGATWSEPVTLSAEDRTAIFAWVDANPAGEVGVVWYEADQWGDPNDLQAEWHVQHARFSLDRENLSLGEPAITQVTETPVHTGAICNAGLGCVLQGRANDRRLLDFFEIDVDDMDKHHITWTVTHTDVPTVWYGQVRVAPPALLPAAHYKHYTGSTA